MKITVHFLENNYLDEIKKCSKTLCAEYYKQINEVNLIIENQFTWLLKIINNHQNKSVNYKNNFVSNSSGFYGEINIEYGIGLFTHQEIKKMNNLYRQKNNATNILSFPSYSLMGLISKLSNNKMPCYIGDIAICPNILKKEALEAKNKAINHFTHLLIHGFLHLLSFDHVNKEDANLMESTEIKLLTKMLIVNPYNTYN